MLHEPTRLLPFTSPRAFVGKGILACATQLGDQHYNIMDTARLWNRREFFSASIGFGEGWAMDSAGSSLHFWHTQARSNTHFRPQSIVNGVLGMAIPRYE